MHSIQYQSGVHSDQMVLLIVRRGGWTVQAVAKRNSRRAMSPLRSDILMMARQGGWTTWAVAKRRSNLNLKGNYQARIYSDQMDLMAVRQVGWIAWAVAKDTQMKFGKKNLQPRGLLRWWGWQPNKKSTYSFSGDDEEVRCWRWSWWWVENYCAVTDLCDSNIDYWLLS